MAITAIVAVSQSSMTPAYVTLTDQSTGSDVTIVKRRVYFTDSAGNYLPTGMTTTYTEWNDFPTTTTLTLNLLTQDTAVHLRVDYLTVADVVVTSFEDDYPLSEFNKQFFGYLFQQQALMPRIYQDTNYGSNLAELWINIIGGVYMVEGASDLAAAQNAMNIATNLRLNQNLYF